MRLRELLLTIWERRWVVALVLVFCLVGASLYALSQPRKEYASSATVAFLPDPKRDQVTPSENLSSLLATYAVVAQSATTLEAAAEILGHPVPGSVSASTASDSWILAISSEASTSQAAEETVSAVTKALTNTIRDNEIVLPTVINPPVASTAPIQSRSPALIISLAAIIGLIAGVLFVLLLDNLASVPRGQPQLPGQGTESSA